MWYIFRPLTKLRKLPSGDRVFAQHVNLCADMSDIKIGRYLPLLPQCLAPAADHIFMPSLFSAQHVDQHGQGGHQGGIQRGFGRQQWR